ncbi:MAG: AIM24 family protein, partial [Desulfobulbaceae bacterium]|nr:AIM24 family protein [Desulfobulbaceae bacterium]
MGEFQVVITGVLLNETTRQEAVASLHEKLKLPMATAETLMSGKPRVVKKNVDEKVARQLKQRFKQLGIDCKIMAMKKPAATPPPVEWAEKAIAKTKKDVKPTKSIQAFDAKVITSDLDHPGYQFTIEGRPDYSFLTVRLPANESLKIEASAMATMDTNIQMKTKFKGG